MGSNIKKGVVDGFLNVFGTKNLKVADLSIAPILPDGNTSMPAQMIGLNAVRFIQQENVRRRKALLRDGKRREGWRKIRK
jgi:choline dehydrogenase